MKRSLKEHENITILLDLVKNNPELEVVPMVDTYCAGDDSYSWWLAKWGRACIDEYYISDEHVYRKSHDFDDLVEKFIDDNFDEMPYKNMSDDKFEKIAENIVDNYKWEKAIMVFIDQL